MPLQGYVVQQLRRASIYQMVGNQLPRQLHDKLRFAIHNDAFGLRVKAVFSLEVASDPRKPPFGDLAAFRDWECWLEDMAVGDDVWRARIPEGFLARLCVEVP